MQTHSSMIDCARSSATTRNHLLWAVRAQIRKDNYGERAILVSELLSRRRLLRYGLRILDFTVALKVLGGAIFCLSKARISVPKIECHLALFQHAGEKVTWNRLARILKDRHIRGIEYGARAEMVSIPIRWKLILTLLFKFKHSVRPRSLLFLIARRYPLYVSLRASETLFLYFYLRHQWRKNRPLSVTVFTEGSPHGLASIAVANALGIPLVFAAHAPLITNPCAVQAQLGILYGPQSEKAFLLGGAKFDQTVQFGWIDRDLDTLAAPKNNLCISLSKDVALPALNEILVALRENRNVGAVTVRPHPNSLVSRESLRKAIPEGTVVSEGTSLSNDLKPCSFHIAGNSTVHLESIARGVPSFYLRELDHTGNFPIQPIRDGQIARVHFQKVNVFPEESSPPTNAMNDLHFEVEKKLAQFTAELNEKFPRRGVE